MRKSITCAIAMMCMSLGVYAQSGTNSPYSQYGLGVLSDQSQGRSRGMGGLSMGLRSNDQINFLNPASYSAVDSLTMLFDVGLSGQITNFKEAGKRVNAKNADFEYAVASFRALPRLGVSLGIVPFTNIGYDYESSYKEAAANETYVTFYESHEGSGGIHQAFIGMGWNVLGGLSIGFNASYLWGSYEKSTSIESSDSYVNEITRTYVATVKSYKIDFGLQFQTHVTPKDVLTLGATYTFGHNLNASAESQMLNINSQTSVYTGDTVSVSDAFELPDIFSVGFALTHNDRLTIGFDYTFQKWGDMDFPETNDITGEYVMTSGLLKDMHKYTLGAEWVPNMQSRKFLGRIRYRIGASYSTPYITVNGLDGPKEYSISAGFGIPIVNNYNNRSLVNISAQWTHSSADELVSENIFRINIGVTFNERWFMKWKVE